MTRLSRVFALLCGIAMFAVAGAVAAPGKGGQTIAASCTVAGKVTIHASSGGSAWVNNSHYVLLKMTGTFTPTGGTPQTFTKVYGHKHGFRPAQMDTCTGSQTTAAGSFSFSATAARTGKH
jgi:hypothetical protein